MMGSGQQTCGVERAEVRGVLGLDWRLDHRSLWLELVAGEGLAADLAVDVPRDLGVSLEEVARILATLAKPSVAVRKEGARLLDQTQLDSEVQQPALARDASGEQDVELGDAKGRATLFLTTLTLTRLPTTSVPCLMESMRRMSSRTDA